MPGSIAAGDDGRAGAAPRHDAPGTVVQVRYADESPTVLVDGARVRFGRDDDVCEVPIWEQIRARTLSRVAGELWIADGSAWVRNLSTSHELVVEGGPTVHVLPARSTDDVGYACTVPAPRGRITAPSTGTWQILVATQPGGPSYRDDRRRDGPADAGPTGTVRLDDIPARLEEVAESLCAPLTAGGGVPATYASIARERGWTVRVARRRAEDLCTFYAAQVEALPGGRRAGETLTTAVARALVERGKVRPPSGAVVPGPEEQP